MYTDEPWSLKKDTKKSAKVKKAKTKSQKPTGDKFFVEDKAVSTARVLQFFEDNKNKSFTNKELSEKLGLSEGTITGITTRLEALRKIKIIEILQRVSAYTVLYQHIDGPNPRVNKRRGVNGDKKDTAQLVWELFSSDKNKVYSKKEIIKVLKTESESQISESLRILLLSKSIKLVKEGEYQNVRGNLKGEIVHKRHDNQYTTLHTFLDKNEAVNKKEFFEKELKNKEYKLFYSSMKIIKEYKIADLNKILKSSNNILRRIFKRV